MKTKLLRVAGVASVIVCCAVVGSCVCGFPGPWGENTIIFEKYRIRIPGNKITAEDQRAMNKILHKYDKSLYRIQTFENGKRGESIGALSSVLLPLAVVRKVFDNAQTHSLTGVAIQAGRGWGGNAFHHQSPEAQPDEAGIRPGGNRFLNSTPPHNKETEAAVRRIGNKFRFNDAALVSELRPILEKYNKEQRSATR
ncbi:MAG: hypothetical protein H0W66_11765 [Chthoniobacterales bacterium]|nr:hypothetical protein [Chthoniobacterales bacterium]